MVSRLLALVLLLAPLPATAQTPRVVVALTSAEPSDWTLTLHNLSALLAGMPGAQVELVAYGPGISFVEKTGPDAAQITALEAEHVHFVACANAMRAEHVEPSALVPGVAVVPSGIVEVVRREQQGWSYIHAGR